MLTSLTSLLGSSKAATTIAGLSLAVATVGVAGAATLPDDAHDDAKSEVEDLQVPASDDADPRATDAHENAGNGEVEGQGEGEPPAWLDRLHDYIANTDDEGCEFGLGVAAIAGGTEKDLPAPDCGDEIEEIEGASQGDDASNARGDNGAVANDGVSNASETSGNDNVPTSVPAGSADTADDYEDAPQGGPETGSNASADHRPSSDG